MHHTILGLEKRGTSTGTFHYPQRSEFGSIMKGVDGRDNKKEEHCHSLQKRNAPFNHRGGSGYIKGNKPHSESAVKHFSTGHPRLNQQSKALPRQDNVTLSTQIATVAAGKLPLSTFRGAKHTMCRLTIATYTCTSHPAYTNIIPPPSLQPAQPLQHTLEVRAPCIFRHRLENSFTTKPTSLYAYLPTYCTKDSECPALREKVGGPCPACRELRRRGGGAGSR